MQKYNSLTIDIHTTDLNGQPVKNKKGKVKSTVVIKLGTMVVANGIYGGRPTEETVKKDFHANPNNKARFTLDVDGFEAAKRLGLVK